jgi:hypothetical protein
MKTPEEILIENRVLVNNYDPTKKFQLDMNLSRDGWIATIEQIIKSMIEYAEQANTNEAMPNNKKAINTDEALKIQEQYEGRPHGWVQWKGTDVCMDVYCKCGHHSHIDAYFAYHVKCPKCGTVYMCNGHIELIEVEQAPENGVIVPELDGY